MRIINLVDRFDKVNFGIWNAACATTTELSCRFGVKSELWFPADGADLMNVPECELVPLAETNMDYLLEVAKERRLLAETDIIVSHGCWCYPTLLAEVLQGQGFKWMYVPHGMLEPWSLRQKYLLKKSYFWWREYPYSKQADVVRAVGEPEEVTLRKKYDQTVLIPNGVAFRSATVPEKPECKSVLFMARLHHKKGIVPLVKAWLDSDLFAHKGYELLIAGPDDGELAEVTKLLNGSALENVRYLGAVYGVDKIKLLEGATYYILPSVSEGFPTSVLEAMSFGLLPIITEGCNFPTVFTEGVALEIEQDYGVVLVALNGLMQRNDDWIKERQQKAIAFVNARYTLDTIAELQYKIFTGMLE